MNERGNERFLIKFENNIIFINKRVNVVLRRLNSD